MDLARSLPGVATLQAVKEAYARGWLIIGMGKNAQKALRDRPFNITTVAQ
jgi:hypothetical protein